MHERLLYTKRGAHAHAHVFSVRRRLGRERAVTDVPAARPLPRSWGAGGEGWGWAGQRAPSPGPPGPSLSGGHRAGGWVPRGPDGTAEPPD